MSIHSCFHFKPLMFHSITINVHLLVALEKNPTPKSVGYIIWKQWMFIKKFVPISRCYYRYWDIRRDESKLWPDGVVSCTKSHGNPSNSFSTLSLNNKKPAGGIEERSGELSVQRSMLLAWLKLTVFGGQAKFQYQIICKCTYKCVSELVLFMWFRTSGNIRLHSPSVIGPCSYWHDVWKYFVKLFCDLELKMSDVKRLM